MLGNSTSANNQDQIYASCTYIIIRSISVSVLEWLERRDCDRHSKGSKSTSTIFLGPWKDALRLHGGLGKQF